jgi:N-acetyl-gamma-glutamylphosphate reductase
MNATEIDSLKNFYEDSEIFITGGSGYIGKVLIEKLLRSCTRVKKIYLLMRPRKGKSVDDRVQEIWDSMVRLLTKETSTFFWHLSIFFNYSYSTRCVNQTLTHSKSLRQ